MKGKRTPGERVPCLKTRLVCVCVCVCLFVSWYVLLVEPRLVLKNYDRERATFESRKKSTYALRTSLEAYTALVLPIAMTVYPGRSVASQTGFDELVAPLPTTVAAGSVIKLRLIARDIAGNRQNYANPDNPTDVFSVWAYREGFELQRTYAKLTRATPLSSGAYDAEIVLTKAGTYTVNPNVSSTIHMRIMSKKAAEKRRNAQHKRRETVDFPP